MIEAEKGYTITWVDDEGNTRSARINQETTVGRDPGDPKYRVLLITANDRVDTGIHDASVSRTHAELRPSHEGIIVADVGTRGRGSTNGTYINEERIPPGGTGLAKPGDTIRFGLYTVVKVGYEGPRGNVVVVRPGESLVLPRESINALTGVPGVEVADVGPGKVAVYFSGDAPSGSIDLGLEKVKVSRQGTVSKRTSMLLDMRLKLVESLRLLELSPPRLEEAAVKLAVLVRLRRYRELLEDAAGRDVIEELEAAVDSVRRGRPVPGVETRLSTIASFLLELIDSLRSVEV